MNNNNRARRGLIIDYNSVAAYIAHEGAEIQAEFLNAFCKELQAACETAHHAEMQMAYMTQYLKPETKELLRMLTFEEKP